MCVSHYRCIWQTLSIICNFNPAIIRRNVCLPKTIAAAAITIHTWKTNELLPVSIYSYAIYGSRSLIKLLNRRFWNNESRRRRWVVRTWVMHLCILRRVYQPVCSSCTVYYIREDYISSGSILHLLILDFKEKIYIYT